MGSNFLTRPGIFFDQDGTLNKWRWIDVELVKAPGYFLTVEPHQSVIDASLILKREGLPVGTYGAVWEDGHSRNDKNCWMDINAGHIPLTDRFYVPCGTEKASMFVDLIHRPITRADILLDDNSNVGRSWEEYGGTFIKVYDEGVNGRHGTWHGPSVSTDMSAEEIAKYVLDVQGRAVSLMLEEAKAVV